LQSAYFCKVIGASLVIYVPKFLKFLMYFENDVVQVDMDDAYLTSSETARAHAVEIVRSQGLPEPAFIEPKNFTAPLLPDIPVNFGFMCCSHAISAFSSKIGLGYIGLRVRRIIRSAKFPVLIAGAAYKPWASVAVLFGGGGHTAVRAFRLGLRISRLSGLPMDVFTLPENQTAEDYRRILEAENLGDEMNKQVRRWEIFDSGDLAINLYRVPHDALVVMGSPGHGLIREMLFGSVLEKVRSLLPNNFLIAGPKYKSSM
ncbi:MAG: universal stress protein UspA, partial [Desulfobacterales bacterium CG23_combo_of_CG06-09_8_20_14_all_51_8]